MISFFLEPQQRGLKPRPMTIFGTQTLPVQRFFFIRHAQSEGNVKGVFHSNKADWALTPEGHGQAQRAAPILDLLPVTAVISSPMVRVQQTIAPYLAGKQMPHASDSRLIERDFAGVEGMKIPVDRNFFIEDPEGVEPTPAFIQRIIAGLQDGLRQEDMLFAAHAGVMHGLALGLGLDCDPWAGPYNNATPAIFSQAAGKWSVQFWDFGSGGWQTPPPATRDWTKP